MQDGSFEKEKLVGYDPLKNEEIVSVKDVEKSKNEETLIIRHQDDANVVAKDERDYLANIIPLEKFGYTFEWLNVSNFIRMQSVLKFGLNENDVVENDENMFEDKFIGLKNIHPYANDNKNLKHDEFVSLTTSVKLLEGNNIGYPLLLTHDKQVLDGRNRLKVFHNLGYKKIYCAIIDKDLSDGDLYQLFRTFESGRHQTFIDKLIFQMRYLDKLLYEELRPNFKMQDLTNQLKYSTLTKDVLTIDKISDMCGISIKQLKLAFYIWRKDKNVLIDISNGKKYVTIDGLVISRIKTISDDLVKRNGDRLEEDLIGKCFGYKEEVEQGQYLFYITSKYPKYITERKEREKELIKQKYNKLFN